MGCNIWGKESTAMVLNTLLMKRLSHLFWMRIWLQKYNYCLKLGPKPDSIFKCFLAWWEANCGTWKKTLLFVFTLCIFQCPFLFIQPSLTHKYSRIEKALVIIQSHKESELKIFVFNFNYEEYQDSTYCQVLEKPHKCVLFFIYIKQLVYLENIIPINSIHPKNGIPTGSLSIWKTTNLVNIQMSKDYEFHKDTGTDVLAWSLQVYIVQVVVICEYVKPNWANIFRLILWCIKYNKSTIRNQSIIKKSSSSLMAPKRLLVKNKHVLERWKILHTVSRKFHDHCVSMAENQVKKSRCAQTPDKIVQGLPHFRSLHVHTQPTNTTLQTPLKHGIKIDSSYCNTHVHIPKIIETQVQEPINVLSFGLMFGLISSGGGKLQHEIYIQNLLTLICFIQIKGAFQYEHICIYIYYFCTTTTHENACTKKQQQEEPNKPRVNIDQSKGGRCIWEDLWTILTANKKQQQLQNKKEADDE
ncbi:hypothetical protein VP01_1507g1 [Puccinia sorghi]|uniref:Uncharacterized protein n=1 Tax=Puccinia sorghi TaxID=27349 RepID=A0A0L6VJI9_9BASI|nr:hypothetical protein VP01_1507g1 [Puccinia sorghi]